MWSGFQSKFWLHECLQIVCLCCNNCSPMKTHACFVSCVLFSLWQARLIKRKRVFPDDIRASLYGPCSSRQGFPGMQSLISDVAGNGGKKILTLGVFTLVLTVFASVAVYLFLHFLFMPGFHPLPTLVLVSVHSLWVIQSLFLMTEPSYCIWGPCYSTELMHRCCAT